MSNKTPVFLDTSTPKVMSEINNRSPFAPRWAILVGNPSQPLYEYLRDALCRSGKWSQRLQFAVCDPTFDRNRQFLEEHMVSSTPSILLIRKGQQEAFITGAISLDRLTGALDDLFHDGPQERLAAALAELAEEKSSVVDDGEPFVKIGVSPEGFPIYAKKSDLDAGEAPSV